MQYTSQKTKFGSYLDGKSFSGVTEYYFATLANDLDAEGTPNEPTFNSSTWKKNIQDTQFGKRHDKSDANNGIIYKYLWNVEVVSTIDSSGTTTDEKPTSEVLLQIYNGGRIPETYISYYASNSEAEVPDNQPVLDSKKNNIVVPAGSKWATGSNLSIGADVDTYLFEMTFVKYEDYDDNGKNLIALVEGPTLIGRNGKDSLVLTLDNDNDVIAINANGKIVGQDANKSKVLVSTTASVVRNGVQENGFNFDLTTPTGQQWAERKNGAGHYTFSNGKLEIYDIPSGFSQGNFTISDTKGDLKATFGLRTTTSNVDYNLNIATTLINSSICEDEGGDITVQVNKTKEDGSVETISGPADGILIYLNDTTQLSVKNGVWEKIHYDKGQTEDIKVTIRDGAGFVWDWETIEFVQNGLTARSLKIVSNKNTFNYTNDKEAYPNQVINMTLQGSNIVTNQAKWTLDSEHPYQFASGPSCEIRPDTFDIKSIETIRLRFLYANKGHIFSGSTTPEIWHTSNKDNFKWNCICDNDGDESQGLDGLDGDPALGATFFGEKYYIVGYNALLYTYDPNVTKNALTSTKQEGNIQHEQIASNDNIMIIVGKVNNYQQYWLVTISDKNVISFVGKINNPSSGGSINDICNTGSNFFACGSNSNDGSQQRVYLISGTNGSIIKNQLIENIGTHKFHSSFYHNNKYFVGYGNGGTEAGVLTLNYNDNGDTKEFTIVKNSVFNGLAYVRSINYFDGMYYAFGYISGSKGGQIWSSIDGINWELETSSNTAAWCSEIIDGQLYWAGEKGEIHKYRSVTDFAIIAEADGLYDKTSISSLVDASSPYVLSLSNDSAMVGADRDNNVNKELLKTISTTTATLSYGDIQQTSVQFDWAFSDTTQAGGSIYSEDKDACDGEGKPLVPDSKYTAIYNASTIYLTDLTKDSVAVTVSAYLKINDVKQQNPIAKKVFTITKNKSGDSAIAYQLNITPNKINEAEFGTNSKYTVQIGVIKHDGRTTSNIDEEYYIKVDNGTLQKNLTNCEIEKRNTNFTLYVGEDENKEPILQDTETVEVTPILYDFKAMATPSQITTGLFPTGGIQFDLRQVGKGSSQLIPSTIKTVRYKIDSGSYVQPGTVGRFTIPLTSFSDKKTNFIVEIEYAEKDTPQENEWKIFDKVTINVLIDATTSYIVYHDLLKPDETLPSLNKETPFDEIPTYDKLTGTSYPKEGWYRGIEPESSGNKGSVYSMTKVCKASEYNSTPWGEPTRLSGVLTEMNDLLDLLDDDSQGIYNDRGNIIVNASAIKTGVFQIKPKGSDSPIFETGWDDDGDPVVNIGGVSFVGTVPATTNDISNIQIGGRNLLKNSAYWSYRSNNSAQYPVNETFVTEDNKSFYRYQRYKLGNNVTNPQGVPYDEVYKAAISLYNTINSTDMVEDIFSKEITLSFWAKGNKNRLLYFSASTFDENSTASQGLDGAGGDINITTKWKQYWLTTTVNRLYTKQGLRFGPSYNDKETSEVWDFQLDICQLKIEYGNKATDWTEAQEDTNSKISAKMSPSVSGTYSWKFDQNDGLYMWKGLQSTNPIMKVDTDGLELTGKIHAEAGGTIGGWEITENSLTQRKEGTGPAIAFISGTGTQSLDYSVGDSGGKKNWLIWAKGDQTTDYTGRFGVDASGAIYATKGKIGNMEIGELTNRASAVIGENLLLNSNVEVTNNTYNVNNYTPISPLIPGEKYTITVCATPGSGVKYLSAYFSSGYTSVCSLNFSSDVNATNRGMETLSAAFTMRYYEGKEPTVNPVYANVNLYRFDSQNVGNQTSTTTFGNTTIHWVKIEKGEVSTPWCLAQQEQQSNSVNGNYSWKFSPTEGIKMWDGSQTTDPIFKVDGRGLYMKGNGEFSGVVTADEGNFGSLYFKDNAITLSAINYPLNFNGFSIVNINANESSFSSSGKMIIENTEAKTAIILDKNNDTDEVYSFKATKLEYSGGSGYVYWSVYNKKGENVYPPKSINGTFYYGRYQVKANGTWELTSDQINSASVTASQTQKSGKASVTIGENLFLSDFFAICDENDGNKLLSNAKAWGCSTSDYGQNVVELSPSYTFDSEDISSTTSTKRIVLQGDVVPQIDNTYLLGVSTIEWKEIWCRDTSVNSASDKNLKKDIDFFPIEYDVFFDNLLPVRYKFIVNDSDRYHSGFISQEVEEALKKANLTGQDFGGFLKFKRENNVEGYGLRYGEFIALNTWQIQKLKPRVSLLEQTIIDYESRISHLETEIENLKNS